MFKGERNEYNPPTATKLQIYKQKAIFILIIVAVVALGLLAINQFIGFKSKMVFLLTPCDLCLDLNPHLEDCFKRESVVYTPTISPNINGDEINISFIDSYLT